MTTPSQPSRANDPLFAMTVEDVCRLAWDYFAMRTASARELLRSTRYAEVWRSISVETLADELARHPDWVDAWFRWSEDKQTSYGWYVSRCGSSEFEVGYYPTIAPTRFRDRTEACAVFVRNELASIADVGPLPE